MAPEPNQHAQDSAAPCLVHVLITPTQLLLRRLPASEARKTFLKLEARLLPQYPATLGRALKAPAIKEAKLGLGLGVWGEEKESFQRVEQVSHGDEVVWVERGGYKPLGHTPVHHN